MKKISCIIPFYNEGQRIFPVLETVHHLQAVDEIICVDDGSQDQTAHRIKARFPEIHVVRLLKNEGKQQQ